MPSRLPSGYTTEHSSLAVAVCFWLLATAAPVPGEANDVVAATSMVVLPFQSYDINMRATL
jgi:hypothetical protein